MIALTHRISPRMSACELSFVERTPIDLARAEAQHGAYLAALREAGAEVIALATHLEHPDAVFVEDTAVVLDELAIVTRPGASSRRGECAAIAEALRPHRELRAIDAPGVLEGGDVLRVGRTLYVGLGTRSDREGHAQLARLVRPYDYEVRSVPLRGCLHLKTGATALDEQTLLAQPEWIDLEAFAGFRVLPVDPREPFAANTLRVGETLLVSASHPRTRERIEAAGFATRALAIGEIERAEGGLTCLSLLFRSRRAGAP